MPEKPDVLKCQQNYRKAAPLLFITKKMLESEEMTSKTDGFR